MNPPDAPDAWALFHNLWTKAAVTSTYVYEEWRALWGAIVMLQGKATKSLAGAAQSMPMPKVSSLAELKAREPAPHIVQVVTWPNLGLGARENDTQLYGLDTKGRLWKFRPQYGSDAAWISVDAQFFDANGSPFVGK